MNLPPLQAGDCLVFSRRSVFNWLIMVKTFSWASHVETYIGEGKTVAARNGQGAKVYDEDLTGLYCVLRPKQPFDLPAALKVYYTKWDGLKYGWLTLLNFLTPFDLGGKDVFCSELATLFYRAGGLECFKATIDADKVAPSDFLYVPDCVLETIWTK